MMGNLFFWLSKFIWFLIEPGNLLFGLLTLGCVLLMLGDLQPAKMLIIGVVTCYWLITILPIADWLLVPLETRMQTNPDLPEKLDGIIVLGGSEYIKKSKAWQQPELKQYAERLFTFIHFAKRYPDAKLLYTGGSGLLEDDDFREADVAKMFFEQQGFDVSRIQFERTSRNTYENVVRGKPLVKPEINQKWLLITSASHMPRAVGVFCQVEWPVIPYPVDHVTIPNDIQFGSNFTSQMNKFNFAVREWLGLTAYYFTGKTNAWFPKQC